MLPNLVRRATPTRLCSGLSLAQPHLVIDAVDTGEDHLASRTSLNVLNEGAQIFLAGVDDERGVGGIVGRTHVLLLCWNRTGVI